MKRFLPKTRLPIALTKPAKRVAIFIISVLVLILLSRISGVRHLVQGMQYQLTRFGTWMGNGYHNIVASEETLIGERNALKEEVAALTIDALLLEELQRQNEEQSLLLDYDKFDPSAQISAHILSRDLEQRRLFLDQGSEQGVKEGLAVIIADGHLIGIIDTVHRQTSEAVLISDTSQSIAATIYGEERTRGRVEGQNGFFLEMAFVPRDELIQLNDIVATSGLDPSIPSQLVIGLVESIDAPDQEPFQTIFIRPIFDVRDFSEVLILDPLASL